MEILHLPVELLDEIFTRLDAITLARSRQVCRTWRHLHEQVKYNLLWRRTCLKDIPEDTLQELTGSVSNCTCDRVEVDRTDDERLLARRVDASSRLSWKDVYQEWFRSRHVRLWPCLVQELRGHRGAVYDARFSGERVISCGEDNTICVWDSWTKHCLHILTGHQKAVLSISLRQRPDCLPHDDNPHDLVISGSKDRTVKVWDMSSWVCMSTLYGHTHWVTSVAVEGNVVVSGSDDDSARIWDISKGTCLHVLRNLGDWVKHVSIWQGTAFTVTDDGRMDLWLTSTAERLLSAEINAEHTSRISGINGAVLRGSNALLVTCDGKIVLWQQSAHENENTPVLHSFSMIGSSTNDVQSGECVAMRGNLVAIGTHSGSVYLYHCYDDWHKQFSKVHAVIQSGKRTINSVAIDDDGEGPCLLTAGDDGIVRVHRWFSPSLTQ